MKNLLLNLAVWRERLRCEPLAVFLDYDGTLAAIAPSPQEAALPFQTHEILKTLVKIRDVKVAVVSGRAIRELQEMVRVPGCSYVGSHGLELRSAGMTFCYVPRKYLSTLQALEQRLSADVQDISGVLLERKPFSFAVHYRKTTPVGERRVKRIALERCSEAVRKGQISVLRGKKVIEIMPPHAMNKGEAAGRLLRIWGKKRRLPIFIGDDRTDESAFMVFRRKGLTVRVGKERRHSAAEYFLNNVKDVRFFLQILIHIRLSSWTKGVFSR